jgi:DNA mismatch repair protein MutH
MTRHTQTPITPQDLVAKLQPLVGKTFYQLSVETGLPFHYNVNSKGVVGLYIEDLVGLSHDNDRLDFSWGDLKALIAHLGQEPGICVIGSLNSLAPKMLDENVSFDNFILGQKVANTVFVFVNTNRKKGGPAGVGWEKFTLESVSAHALKDSSEWGKVCEDWEDLKLKVREIYFKGEKVSSSLTGKNGLLCFNSCAGKFQWQGSNLRKQGGIQLAFGSLLMRKLYNESKQH